MNNDKCRCKHYETDNQRTALIKMDMPDYENERYGGISNTIFRATHFVGYVIVLGLLSYSLWRIRVIESIIETDLQNNSVAHQRTVRSIKDQMLMNSFGGEKNMMGKDETGTAWKKPTNKGEFDQLVNELFDKIKTMHDDQDRGHFDRNMKAVFQAWFPVFDALLPKELKEDTETTGPTTDVSSKDANTKEYFYKPRSENRNIRKRSVDSSEDSGEATGPERSVEDVRDESYENPE